MTNCKNCGMPLVDGMCEYCGTIYREHKISTVYADDRPIVAWDLDRGVLVLPRVVENLDTSPIDTNTITAKVWRWDNFGMTYGGEEWRSSLE